MARSNKFYMIATMESIITALNNREIATAIWLVIAFLWALSIAKVRRIFFDLLKIFFNKKILVPFVVLMLYIRLIILTAEKVGFWDMSAAKDTVFWITGTAIATFFSLNKAMTDTNYFRNIVLDNIKFMLILEFILNLYTFNLAIELILVPGVTFIVMMNAFLGLKPEYKRVKTLLDYVLGFFGIALLIFTFREMIIHFQDFATLKNLRDFLLLPVFSVLLIPCLYFMALYMQYETLFVRVDFANKNSDLAKYVKRKIIEACHLNLSKVIRFSRNVSFPKVNSKGDVADLIKKGNG